MKDSLQRAITIIGGPAAVGRLFAITSQAVSQWDIAPYNRVLELERATKGKVTRNDLRPDIYPPENATKRIFIFE